MKQRKNPVTILSLVSSLQQILVKLMGTCKDKQHLTFELLCDHAWLVSNRVLRVLFVGNPLATDADNRLLGLSLFNISRSILPKSFFPGSPEARKQSL